MHIKIGGCFIASTDNEEVFDPFFVADRGVFVADRGGQGWI